MAETMYPRHPNPTTDEEKLNPVLYQPSAPPAETFNVQLPGGAAAMTTRRRCCGGRCCCWFSWIFGIIFILIIILVITLVLIYYVYGIPTPSTYSVDNVSVKGLNLTLGGGGGAYNETVHSEFDITVSANNTSPKIGISYLSGSSVAVYTTDLLLTNGTMPVFYQPTQNVTVFTVNTTGAVLYTSALSTALNGQNSGGMVPLVVEINAPVMLQLAPKL